MPFHLRERFENAMQSHEQPSSSLPTNPLDRIHSLSILINSTAQALQEDWERREQLKIAEVDRLKQEIEDWQKKEKINLAEVDRLKEDVEGFQNREKIQLAEVDRLKEEAEDTQRRDKVNIAEVDRLKEEIEGWQRREHIQLNEVERLNEEAQNWQKWEQIHLAEEDRLKEEVEKYQKREQFHLSEVERLKDDVENFQKREKFHLVEEERLKEDVENFQKREKFHLVEEERLKEDVEKYHKSEQIHLSEVERLKDDVETFQKREKFHLVEEERLKEEVEKYQKREHIHLFEVERLKDDVENFQKREKFHLVEEERLKEEVEKYQKREQIHLSEVERLKDDVENFQKREKFHLVEEERLKEEVETGNQNYSLLSNSAQHKELDLQVELLTQKKLFIDQELELKNIGKSYNMAKQEVVLLRQELNKAEEKIVKLNGELQLANKQEETKERRNSDEEKSKMKAPLLKGKESLVEATFDRDQTDDAKRAWVKLLTMAQTIVVSTSPPLSFSDLLRMEYFKLRLIVFKDQSRWRGTLREDEIEELWEVMKDKERNIFTMAWLLGWEVVEEPQHLFCLVGSPPLRVAALYCQLIELNGNLSIESISESIPSRIFNDRGKAHLKPCFEKAKIQLVETAAYILQQIPMIFDRLDRLYVKKRYGEAGLAVILVYGLTDWREMQESIEAPDIFLAQKLSFPTQIRSLIGPAIKLLRIEMKSIPK